MLATWCRCVRLCGGEETRSSNSQPSIRSQALVHLPCIPDRSADATAATLHVQDLRGSCHHRESWWAPPDLFLDAFTDTAYADRLEVWTIDPGNHHPCSSKLSSHTSFCGCGSLAALRSWDLTFASTQQGKPQDTARGCFRVTVALCLP